MPVAHVQWPGEPLAAADLLAGFTVLFLPVSSRCRMTVSRPRRPFLCLCASFCFETGGERADSLLRDMKTVKLKSAQNSRSHGACPRQQAGDLACDCVTYRKFSADPNQKTPNSLIMPRFVASHCFTSFTASLKPKWYLSRVIGQPRRLCSRLLGWNISKQLSLLKENTTSDLS